jgi:hypothetical protein
MSSISLDTFEQSSFENLKVALTAKLTTFNESFKSSVRPKNGFYGILETAKNNGIVERIGKTEQGATFKEYLKNGLLQKRAEKLADGRWLETKYDDNGTAYLQSKARYGEITVKGRETNLLPNVEIKKGNFSAYTDANGRPVRNVMNDISLKGVDESRNSLSSIKKDSSYMKTDDRGHLISDRFGGPTSPENVIPQDYVVNRGQIKQVENIVATLKKQGHTVDYEVKTNYEGTKNTRPSSFEPTIKVDGKVYDLPDDLKKIYNSQNQSEISKVSTKIGENFGVAHEAGVKSGLAAAGLTAAISTVDNIRGVMNGELSPQEAFVDVAKDTGTAGAIGYGVAFVSTKIASTMAASGHSLIQTLGRANVPATIIAFGIDSCDSVIDYAQGEISGEKLAIDLGESATGVLGSMAGAAIAGAALGSVVPGAGTAAGFAVGLVGGMVGYVVATEAYATAIEVATGGIDVLADKAEAVVNVAVDTHSVVSTVVADGAQVVGGVANDIASAVADKYTVVSAGVAESADVLKDKALEMGQSVIDSVANSAPEALDDVKSAMNDFAARLGVPIHL